MPNFLYRFRSTERLLGTQSERNKGEKGELEKQEIYFSPFETLNDPLEGYKDIFWQGDQIIWKNFFKHYLLCLKKNFHHMLDNDRSNSVDFEIPVFATPIDFPTDDVDKKCYQDICAIFFENRLIEALILKLASLSEGIKSNAMFACLETIHHHALRSIFKALTNCNVKFQKNIREELSSISGLEELHEIQSENFLLVQEEKIQKSLELELAAKFRLKMNPVDPAFQEKKINLFISFPNKYLKSIEKLLYPDSGVACFMDDIKNLAMWGYYGDSHKGICLRFNSKQNNLALDQVIGLGGKKNGLIYPIRGEVNRPFQQVSYTGKHQSIDFFRSLGVLTGPEAQFWYRDGDDGAISACRAQDMEKWRSNYWVNYQQIITKKQKSWQNEKEYRLTSYGFVDDESRLFRYNFADLDGIIFGIKTPEKEKLDIIEIIKTKCAHEKRKNFNFEQAYYSNGEIKTHPLSYVNEFVSEI